MFIILYDLFESLFQKEIYGSWEKSNPIERLELENAFWVRVTILNQNGELYVTLLCTYTVPEMLLKSKKFDSPVWCFKFWS